MIENYSLPGTANAYVFDLLDIAPNVYKMFYM